MQSIKRPFWVIVFLVLAAGAYLFWSNSTSDQPLPEPIAEDPPPAPPPPLENTSSELPADTQELLPPPEEPVFLPPPRKKIIYKSSYVPEEPYREELPNTPYLVKNETAPWVPIGQQPDTQQYSAIGNEQVNLDTERSSEMNPLRRTWIKVGAGGYVHQQDQTSVTSPLVLLLGLSYGFGKKYSIEAATLQKMLDNTQLSNYPLNRVEIFLNRFFRLDSIRSDLKLSLGVVNSSGAVVETDGTGSRMKDFNSVSAAAGAELQMCLTKTMGLDLQALFEPTISKPKQFSSFDESGWSAKITPQYILDPKVIIGFTVQYFSRKRELEWTAPDNSQLSKTSDANSFWTGLTIEVRF